MNSLLSLVLLLSAQPILSVSSWLTPQPRLSRGLIVTYGGQGLVEANAAWHSYDLGKIPDRCGFASISPVHLGELAYFSMDGKTWYGPCLSVDVQGRDDALDSIFRRHEVAEVSRDMAAKLGFKHGAQGFVFFGACSPATLPLVWNPQPYTVPYKLDTTGESTPSMFPYAKQQLPQKCLPDLSSAGGSQNVPIHP